MRNALGFSHEPAKSATAGESVKPNRTILFAMEGAMNRCRMFGRADCGGTYYYLGGYGQLAAGKTPANFLVSSSLPQI